MEKIIELKYQDLIVVTTSILAESLGSEESQLNKNFNRNKERYIEGVHYFQLTGDDLLLYKSNCPLQISSKTRSLYLWTEKGAFNHVKSLGTDKAWEAYQSLVDTYFRVKNIISNPAPVKPMNTLDFLQATLDQMKAHDDRITQVENKVLLIEAQKATRPDYLTIMGYAIVSKVKVSLTMAAALGKKAKKICTDHGYHIDKVRDPRFGEVGVYPTEVLKQVFETSFA